MKYEVKRGFYSLKFNYADSHTSDEVWCEEPLLMISVGHPEGEHSVSVRRGEVPQLISFLQAIDQDNQRGGAE